MTHFEADLAATTTSMTRLMRGFWLSSVLVTASLGGWAVAAKVDSAVVTGGTFVVQSNAQAVQHLEGGVIGAILVKDGELVQQGQVVARLDAAKVLADVAILDRRLIDLTAEKARLEAELADRPGLTWPPMPSSASQAAALAAAMASQEKLLKERRSTRASQLSQFEERKRQSEMLTTGLNDQIKAATEELAQATADLTDQRMLEQKGLIRRPILRQTEREVARLRGQIGELESRAASAKSQLAETEFKIQETRQSGQSETMGQLQATSAKLAEAQEERTTALDRLQRLDIRAPRTGLVNELAVHTVGGVIGAGQTLMTIVPNTDPLLVTARIKPDEIDQVRVGQPATVRINAFKLATPPELNGTVTGVSPDQVKDDRSGQTFFNVKVSIAPGERSKLEGKELTPGLPAEVLILGESRRVITYLTQPLTDKIGLAFREK